jgi:hypothetical protein
VRGKAAEHIPGRSGKAEQEGWPSGQWDLDWYRGAKIQVVKILYLPKPHCSKKEETKNSHFLPRTQVSFIHALIQHLLSNTNVLGSVLDTGPAIIEWTQSLLSWSLFSDRRDGHKGKSTDK